MIPCRCKLEGGFIFFTVSYIGILFEMETEEAQTTLRQAQGERSGALPLPPFVLSLSKHERRSYPLFHCKL